MKTRKRTVVCSSSKRLNTKYKLYVFRAMIASMLIFFISLSNLSIISSMFNISVLEILLSFNLENPKETMHTVRKIQMVKELELKDLSKHIEDPKTLRGMNHAALNRHFRRCFFLLQHEGEGPNITEQVHSCKTRQAVLFYPRNREEVYHAWSFYRNSRKLKHKQWYFKKS